MATNFDLITVVVPPEIPGVYRFAWGTQQPFSGATLGDQSAYGSFTTTYVAQGAFAYSISPDELPVPKAALGSLTPYPETSFNLVDDVVPPVTPGVYRFRWGNAQGIVHPALPETQFGYAYAYNFALGVTTTSIVQEWEFNSPVVTRPYDNAYIPDTAGFPISFNLVQSEENLTVVNFDFSGFISVGTGSINDGAFGTPVVYNQTTYVTPTAWVDETFGTAELISLLNRVYPVGMPSDEAFGYPALQNQKLSITTPGISTSTVGGANFAVNTLQVITTPGISAPTVSPDGRLNFMQAITQTNGIPAAAVPITTVVYNSLQVITTPGVSTSTVGGANRVSNYTQAITTPGISAPAVPTNDVVSSLNAMFPAGIPAIAVPTTTTLTKFVKELTNVGGIAAPVVSSSTELIKLLQVITQDAGIPEPAQNTGTSLGLPAIIVTGIPAPAVNGVDFVESLFIPPKYITNVEGIPAPYTPYSCVVSNGEVIVPVDHGTPYSCLPTYEYVPTSFISSDVDCVAPGYDEHRSRRIVTTALTSLFFRSKEQGESNNLIEISLSSNTFTVYYDGDVVEQYANITMGQGGIAALRTKLAASEYIQMPALKYDIFDTRTHENDGGAVIVPPPGTNIPAGGLGTFSRQFLSGASGPPEDFNGLASIRTGPTRTMCIVHTTESVTGAPISLHQPRQWNGYNWISYANVVQGSCPV